MRALVARVFAQLYSLFDNALFLSSGCHNVINAVCDSSRNPLTARDWSKMLLVRCNQKKETNLRAK